MLDLPHRTAGGLERTAGVGAFYSLLVKVFPNSAPLGSLPPSAHWWEAGVAGDGTSDISKVSQETGVFVTLPRGREIILSFPKNEWHRD